MSASILELQELVVKWANHQFPNRKANETLAKLVLEEIPELAKTPTADEFADILILVLDLGYLLEIDLEKAIRDKIQINRARSWIKDPKVGYWRHIRRCDFESEGIRCIRNQDHSGQHIIKLSDQS